MDYHHAVAKAKAWIENTRKRRAIRRMREHLAFFGYDVSDVTDEEIQERAEMMAQAISQSGCTAREVAAGLSMLAWTAKTLAKEQD